MWRRDPLETAARRLFSSRTCGEVRGAGARGRVLPVGGVREKALAALRHGITRVVLPKANLQDVAEIPRELKRRIEFIPVSTMREVLDAVLEQPPEWRSPQSVSSSDAPGRAPAAARPPE